MRLERIFRHRVIRFLRVVLPILVIGLVSVPAWNYYVRRVRTTDAPRTGPKLPRDVTVRTEGFTYSSTKGERTQFTVRARRSLAFKDEKYVLEDVDVTVYGATEKEPTRTIRGDNCTYDQVTNDFTCNGNVEIALDERTLVRTENLIYSHDGGTAVAPRHATIEQGGSTGEANSFEYSMNTGLLKLNGAVRIRTAGQVEVETETASFQQKENWTTMSGGVFIKSSNGWIRGSTGRGDLEAGTFSPKKITIQGEVTAESLPPAGDSSWKLRAGWTEAIISPAGAVEQVKARENVDIEKFEGGTRQRLEGSEIDAVLIGGEVDVLEARHNARMILGQDQTLESARIWTNATGVIRTTDNSVLKVGDSTVTGNDFLIQNGDIVTFRTLRPATLKEQSGQESSSDQLQARFDGRESTLLELVQSGNFRFRTARYEGRAQTGRFQAGGDIVTLEGAAVVNDPDKRLEAAEIRINQKDNSFVAMKNVSTLIKDPAEQVLVKAASAVGGGDSVLYTGNVQLWQKDGYIKAGRLKATGQGQENVKMYAEASAEGKVESHLQNVRVTSRTLDYDDSSGIIRYLGAVRAQKQDMILETSEMTVHFRDGNVTEIAASGGVAVTRADQRGSGENAQYDAATDVVTLTGKNAQVSDREHGLIQAPTLTMKNRGENVLVTGAEGRRTLTKHPVKNNKK